MVSEDFSQREDELGFDWSERVRHYFYYGKVLLIRYWWLLILVTALGATYEFHRVTSSAPRYESRAKVMLSGFVANSVTTGIQEQFSYWFGNQVQIMQSPAVQQATRDRVSAFQPDLERCYVSINPRQIPETAVILIVAEGTQREYTRAYLNALIDEYINFRQQLKGETSERALLAIAERLDGLERSIARQEDAVVAFRREHNLSFVQEQGDVAGTNLARLQAQEAELRTKLRFLEILGKDYKDTLHLFTADADIFGESSEGSSFLEARERYDQLKAEHAEFSRYLKPKHPKMIALLQDIERASNMVRIFRDQALERIEERKTRLRAQLENLHVVIAEQSTLALNNSRLMAEFERMQANLERARTLYDNLLKSIQTLETGQQIDPELVEPLERASAPYEIRPSLPRNVIRGAVMGVFLGVGLMVVLGALDGRILSADDLKRRYDYPVLGIIPSERTRPDGRLNVLAVKDTRHLFAEACRTLRSSIFFMGDEDTRPQVILVTSSIPTEGKSTIALNLAVAIAFTSSKTILVDCDLRRGHLAKELELNTEKGLAEVLAGSGQLDECIQSSSVEHLDFLGTGAYPEKPGELLLSRRMNKVLDELRSTYDYVVIDTAPILATDDTSGFSARADSVLFVTRASYTQARQVKSSLDRLEMRDAPLGGFVLNCADIRGNDYYYYRKYHDYYAYGGRA